MQDLELRTKKAVKYTEGNSQLFSWKTLSCVAVKERPLFYFIYKYYFEIALFIIRLRKRPGYCA